MLSARALSPSAGGLSAERAAKRCVSKGLIAVAMRIPKSVEEKRRKKCQRRFCPKGGFPFRTARQVEKQREVERVATVMDRNAGAAASERAEAAASEGKGRWFLLKTFVFHLFSSYFRVFWLSGCQKLIQNSN